MLEAPPPAQAVAAALRPAPSIDLAGELAAQERRLQLGEELFERLARDGVGAGLTGHEHARLVETMLDAADRLFLESLGYGSRQIQKGIWRWASIL
ncbi:MAG TPA: hypothetical protein VL096_01630, partial [Pirellulaceae bacterium]|nr:hypothetical protein [Pirellulaceae bacterium]